MTQKLMVAILSEKDAAAVRDSGCTILAEYPNARLVRATKGQEGKLADAGLDFSPVGDPSIQVSGTRFTRTAALAADEASPVTVDPDRAAYFLVMLVGPAKGEWLQMLKASGATIQTSLPGNTLLIGIAPAQVAAIRAFSWIEQISSYRAAMKLSPKLAAGSPRELSARELATADVGGERGPTQVEITVFDGESSQEQAARVRSAGGSVISVTRLSIVATVPRESLGALAEHPGVQSILPHEFPEFHNDQARTIMTVPVDQTFGDFTLRGNGQTIGIADSGLDTGNPAAIHADFTGRVTSIVSMPNQLAAFSNDAAPFDDGAQDTNSAHGTHVTGSVIANGAAAIALADPTVPRGVAPDARVVFQAIEQRVTWKTAAQLAAAGLAPFTAPWPPPAVGLWGLPNDLLNLFTPAYAAGVRVHTNSWGASVAGVYTASSRQVDQFMFNNRDMLILYSAGNAGREVNGDGVIDADSIGAPGTAKNCVTVGASENNRPAASVPPPGVNANWTADPRWATLNPGAGHRSDNAEGMAAFSSRGPTDDGRIKPDVTAPGSNILSTRSSTFPGVNPLHGDLPAAHPLRGLYCWSGGTSMSTPLVAGAALLVRQHLVEQRGHVLNGVKPSGALIKAFLVNGAAAMAGQFPGEVPAGPNNVSGFGRISLTTTIAPGLLGEMLFSDEPAHAVETGQVRTFEVQAIDAATPMKVTLCWTDAPAMAGAGGIVNHLYLRVRRPDGTLADGDTVPFAVGGSAANNVQQVTIAAPVAGTYEIRVHGLNVTIQSPGAAAGLNPRQDFALAVSNAMGMSTQPVGIAQAIDTTGSMTFFGFIEPAKERAKQLCDCMRINDRLSVTEFSTRPALPNARTPYPLRLLAGFTPDWTDARAAIGALTANGMTPIGAGLVEAANQLAGVPAGVPRAIVLLSDGFNNQPPDPMAALAGIAATIPVFTVALGPAANTTVLQDIANSRPDGAYFSVQSDEDVQKLHEIYATIQALAAGGALVGLSSFDAAANSSNAQSYEIEDGMPELSFLVSWDGRPREVQLIVTGPDGKPRTAKSMGTLERAGSTYRLVRVAAPRAGRWTAEVRHRSQAATRYTLSAAAQGSVRLTASAAAMRGRRLSIVARLTRGSRPLKDAAVVAYVTAPTLSVADVAAKYAKRIADIKLPKALAEQGLTPEQLALVRLSALGVEFRAKKGGLFGWTTSEVALVARGDGLYAGTFALPATGNATVAIRASGKVDGQPCQRATVISVNVV